MKILSIILFTLFCFSAQGQVLEYESGAKLNGWVELTSKTKAIKYELEEKEIEGVKFEEPTKKREFTLKKDLIPFDETWYNKLKDNLKNGNSLYVRSEKYEK